MSDENEKLEGDVETEKQTGTFAEQVPHLSDEQLKKVHETVTAEVDKRNPPDVGAMSDQEFERYKQKVGM